MSEEAKGDNGMEHAEDTASPADSDSAESPSVEIAVSNDRGHRKERTGVVIGDRADKTITVMVERRFSHPLYGKGVKRNKRYHVHDESNACRVGDIVRIVETRPLSKTKRWRLLETLGRKA
jgi:small subunit ribosomal protein S17